MIGLLMRALFDDGYSGKGILSSVLAKQCSTVDPSLVLPMKYFLIRVFTEFGMQRCGLSISELRDLTGLSRSLVISCKKALLEF